LFSSKLFPPFRIFLPVQLTECLEGREVLVRALQDHLGCCSNKEDSIAFQDYLNTADSITLKEISLIFSENLERMVTNKFGNYVIQKLCFREPEFLELTLKFMKENFDLLIKNEFSSRVMQALVDISKKFRDFCLTKFKVSLHRTLTSISTVFLFSAVIKATQDFRETTFLREMVRKNPYLLECKYLKRVMVSYVDNCPKAELDEIIKVLNFRGNLCNYLEDKYSAYIALMLIQRGDAGTIDELITLISKNPIKLFGSKFAGFILTKVIELNDHKLNSKILDALFQVSPILFRKLIHQTSLDTGCFFLYLLLGIKPLESYLMRHVESLLHSLPRNFFIQLLGKDRLQQKRLYFSGLNSRLTR